jgi:hypothetical protein
VDVNAVVVEGWEVVVGALPLPEGSLWVEVGWRGGGGSLRASEGGGVWEDFAGVDEAETVGGGFLEEVCADLTFEGEGRRGCRRVMVSRVRRGGCGGLLDGEVVVVTVVLPLGTTVMQSQCSGAVFDTVQGSMSGGDVE